MNLSEREKKLLFVLSLLIFIILLYTYVYTPYMNKTNLLQANIKDLELQLSELEDEEKGISKTNTDRLEKSIQELEKKLPSELLQERIILAIKELGDNTGVKFQAINFSEHKPSKIQISDKLDNETIKGISDGTIIETNVNIRCLGNYSQIKGFINEATNYKSKIIVKDIILNSQSNNDQITGEINLIFYGYKDTDKRISDWESSVSSGKDNIFR